ncbi:MAG TPA: NADH-quinone oxidoreductase subunit NuoE [Candidatus Hydrogenedentes bacterium]|nr:NADH-quinone oxidoreductase subunit NuoE [Candidatus Hydrogenedentota bacterium]HPG69705.1 NADH-quinone oxidoreductase subunit NuoE [Candidatus Hydrogenedentota bacterium]
MNTCGTDNWAEVEARSKGALPPEVVDFIEQCQSDPQAASNLIAVLHMVQERLGYLGQEQLDAVAQLMHIPAAKVSGVATFYHYFRLRPCGRHIIRVCLGTACYVKGADRVAQRLKEELGIDFGETTTDGLFSLEASRCLGTCGLAPVIMVDEDVHGQVTLDQVPVILDRYIRNARE